MLKEIATDYGILFLTDEIELLREMEKRGEKVALVVTDANRDMDFSGISYAVEKTEELEQEDFDREEYTKLLGKFDEGRNNVLEKVTVLGTQTEFLTTTKDRLETNSISLSTQIDNVVNVDMAEAIMNFSWAQYAYNSALKVGNNILTPSFIDFMG